MCMGQYKEFVEIFKKDLEKEQEKLRIYQRGELRSMTLETGRWCDLTLIAIEQTKQQITELKDRVTSIKNCRLS
jgi:hypothetical protein